MTFIKVAACLMCGFALLYVGLVAWLTIDDLKNPGRLYDEDGDVIRFDEMQD